MVGKHRNMSVLYDRTHNREPVGQFPSIGDTIYVDINMRWSLLWAPPEKGPKFGKPPYRTLPRSHCNMGVSLPRFGFIGLRLGFGVEVSSSGVLC